MSRCEQCDAALLDPDEEHCPACDAHCTEDMHNCPECGEPLG